MSEQLVVNLIKATSSTAVPKRGGGTYPGALLVYTVNGQVFSKGIHENTFSKRPELFEKIKGLESKTGIDLVLVREKKGEFINILDVREAKPGDVSTPLSESDVVATSSSSDFSERFKAIEGRLDALESQVNSEPF